MSPKDFFMYLGVAVTLYASAGSLLALLFAVINMRFRDALDPWVVTSATSTLQFSIATLVVVFPLYLVLSWLIRKEVIANPIKSGLSIRKWFVWLTLFIAGATVAGDVIALINTYMGGEITSRFVWKILSVLVVAAAVFGYYLYDLKRASSGNEQKVNVSLIVLAALAVIAAIVLGFVTVGSPKHQRAVRFDEERVGNLSSIQWEVLNHWQTKKVLPLSLAALEDDFSGFRVPVDPETGASYEYEVTGPLSFELCATFALSNADTGSTSETTVLRDPWGPDAAFVHDAGHVCFPRTIDALKWDVIK